MGLDSIDAVDIVDIRDASALRHRIAHNVPAVIRGGRDASHAHIFEWSTDSLREAMGSRVVPVIETPSPYLSYERDVVDMPFDRFIDRCFGGDDGETFLYFKNSTQLLPDGLDDSMQLAQLAPYIERSAMRNLWISGPGLTVGLHFDPADNLNMQLRGRKRFTLYPPGIRRFYPMPMWSQTGHVSGVFRGGAELDQARFPRFDGGAAVEVILEEGEILYLPAYWWHRVDSLGERNINLNCWWLPTARKQLTHPNQALRGYVGLLIRRLKFGSIERAEEPKTS